MISYIYLSFLVFSFTGMILILNRHSRKLQLGIVPFKDGKGLVEHIVPIVEGGSKIGQHVSHKLKSFVYNLFLLILRWFSSWFGPWASRVEKKISYMINSINGKRELNGNGRTSSHILEIRESTKKGPGRPKRINDVMDIE